MDLIERYLAAIRFDLPSRDADDIIAELRDDLANRVEEREESLGRPLDKAETSALIKEFGHPLVVAGRYRKQQYLIGPEIFPFFFAATRIVLVLIFAALGLAASIDVFVSHRDGVQRIAQFLAEFWPTIFSTIGAMVVVFAILERTRFPAEHILRWKPEALPDLGEKRPSRWEGPFEVAAGIVFLLWWSGVIHFPFAGANGVQVSPGPVWMQLWWPIFAIVAVRLVMSLIAWLRPDWDKARGVLNLVTTIAGLGVLLLVYRSGQWAVVSAPAAPADETAHLTESINLALNLAFATIGVIWVLQCLNEISRLIRDRALIPFLR